MKDESFFDDIGKYSVPLTPEQFEKHRKRDQVIRLKNQIHDINTNLKNLKKRTQFDNELDLESIEELKKYYEKPLFQLEII